MVDRIVAGHRALLIILPRDARVSQASARGTHGRAMSQALSARRTHGGVMSQAVSARGTHGGAMSQTVSARGHTHTGSRLTVRELIELHRRTTGAQPVTNYFTFVFYIYFYLY